MSERYQGEKEFLAANSTEKAVIEVYGAPSQLVRKKFTQGSDWISNKDLGRNTVVRVTAIAGGSKNFYWLVTGEKKNQIFRITSALNHPKLQLTGKWLMGGKLSACYPYPKGGQLQHFLSVLGVSSADLPIELAIIEPGGEPNPVFARMRRALTKGAVLAT